MIGAWSTFPDNNPHGNSHDFGHFEQCKELTDSQYCLIQYQHRTMKVIPHAPKAIIFNYGWKNLHERFSGAICLLKICSDEDVKEVMAKFFNGSDLIQSDDYDQSEYCNKKKLGFSIAGKVFM